MDLEQIKKEYGELSKKLTDPELISDWEKFQELATRRSQLEKIVKKSEELEELKQRVEENNQIIAAQEDELVPLAQEELQSLLKQKETLERELEEFLKEDSNPPVGLRLRGSDSRSGPDAVIMEIRPGTGGDEAALFARDLFEMYRKYAERKEWKYIVLELAETELGGIREASIEFQGREAARKLQQEAGVHRVQRIPATEKAGRIHTSTASVAVLPKAKKAQIQLNPADLRIDIFNASGPGGQNVNKRKTAVRITHLPTGLVVVSQASRNQQQNREFALTLLASKLLSQKREKEGQKIAGARKEQIGSAERAEKIRTYNFPQDRITDHRIGKSWHNLETVMTGDLDEIAETLTAQLPEF